MIIYKTTDRIRVEIGGITFLLSPLSWDQKQDILNEVKLIEGKPNNRNSTYKSLKYAVKGIEGVKLADGSPYVINLENGLISDECVEDLLNLEIAPKLIMTSYSFVHGVPSKIVNPVTGEAVDGVEIVLNAPKKKTK
jgi:hypothetical protein